MTNLTLSIDEDVLRRARIRAIHEDTSVNACVRDFLESYGSQADTDRKKQAMARLIRLSRSISSGGGLADRTWTRDDIHDR